MNKWLILKPLLLGCILLSGTAFAGDPLFRQRGVVLGGGHCVTPIQTFGSPVYSYSSPVTQSYSSSVIQSQEVYSAPVQSQGYDDVATALKIISDFKLKQQALESGLNTLGYNNATNTTASKDYSQQSNYANSINYGLAPYVQGNTQYQVESYELSSYGNDIGSIKDQINALMLLSENMQKNSFNVGSSVSNTVQTLADSASQQAESQIEVARIQSEAVARVAMIQAAANMLKESRLNSKVDVRVDRSIQEPILSEPITLSTQTTTVETTQSVEDPDVAALQAQSVALVTRHCGACHMGGKDKGNFSLSLGGLDKAGLDSSIAQVFSGEMPKQSKLTTAEKLEVAEALRVFTANPE